MARNGDHNSIAACSSLTGKQLQQFKKALCIKNKKKRSPIEIVGKKLDQMNREMSEERNNFLRTTIQLLGANS